MEVAALQKAIQSGHKKAKMLDGDFGSYMLRSILAGLYLSIIVFLFWNLKHNLAASPFGNVVASLFFGVGLFVIVVTQSELFTSNNMYMATSTIARQTTRWQMIKLWTFCYLGNLIGATIMAGLLKGCGVLDALPLDHALYVGAEHKIALTATQIFCKGILANWVVCLAVWVGLHLKEDIAKFFSIIAIVSVFLYLGFEHSIANMGTFAMALMGNSTITFDGILHNMIWATLGNIVGGAVFIGAAYSWLNRGNDLSEN